MKKAKASATVEALLILPIAFTFIYTMMWILELLRIHSEVGAIVNEAGNKIVNYSYALDAVKDNVAGEDDLTKENLLNLVGTVAYSEGYVKSLINKSEVGDKIERLTCLLSLTGNEDEIKIVATYYVKAPLKIFDFEGIYLTNSFYSKTFTGYSKLEGEDEYVYITHGSEVYHTSTDCTALKTTIESCLYSEIKEKRNKDGAKYYECEKCKKAENTGILYYTPYGNRYHYKSDCSELKINVYKIPISEKGERRQCYFCK